MIGLYEILVTEVLRLSLEFQDQWCNRTHPLFQILSAFRPIGVFSLQEIFLGLDILMESEILYFRNP